MLRDMFDFMRRNIHFYDNSRINQKGVRGYDLLFKVSYPLEIIMKGMKVVWTSKTHVTINNSIDQIHGYICHICPVHA